MSFHRRTAVLFYVVSILSSCTPKTIEAFDKWEGQPVPTFRRVMDLSNVSLEGDSIYIPVNYCSNFGSCDNKWGFVKVDLDSSHTVITNISRFGSEREQTKHSDSKELEINWHERDQILDSENKPKFGFLSDQSFIKHNDSAISVHGAKKSWVNLPDRSALYLVLRNPQSADSGVIHKIDILEDLPQKRWNPLRFVVIPAVVVSDVVVGAAASVVIAPLVIGAPIIGAAGAVGSVGH